MSNIIELQNWHKWGGKDVIGLLRPPCVISCWSKLVIPRAKNELPIASVPRNRICEAKFVPYNIQSSIPESPQLFIIRPIISRICPSCSIP